MKLSSPMSELELNTLRNIRSYWYIATVYSKHPEGIEAAFRMACEASAWLVRNKVPIFSPIAHTHPIAVHGKIDPYDHSIWMSQDKPLMEPAHGLIIVETEGWQTSKGICIETDFFQERLRPIHSLEWPLQERQAHDYSPPQ